MNPQRRLRSCTQGTHLLHVSKTAIDGLLSSPYKRSVELKEQRLEELLASPLAEETVKHMIVVIESGMEVRIVSEDKPTMTIQTRFYLFKYLTNRFGWPATPQKSV